MKKRKTAPKKIKRQTGFIPFITTFFCCAVLFGSGVAAMLFFMEPSLKTSAGTSVPYSKAAYTYPASSSFTMLIGIYNEKGDVPVGFLLYRLDTLNNRTVILPLPLKLAVTSQSSVCDTFKEGGTAAVRGAVENLLSIKIDYTCSITSTSLIKILDQFGGLYSEVPEDLSCTLPDGSAMQLKASARQYLTGAKLYTLVASPSYKNETTRLGVQATLMKEFVTEKMTGYYVDHLSDYYGSLFNSVSTDFSMDTLLKRIDALEGLSSPASIRIPQTELIPVYDGLIHLKDLDQTEELFR